MKKVNCPVTQPWKRDRRPMAMIDSKPNRAMKLPGSNVIRKSRAPRTSKAIALKYSVCIEPFYKRF